MNLIISFGRLSYRISKLYLKKRPLCRLDRYTPIMDEYPEEIRLRPIPLAALFGSQELHAIIFKATTIRKEWNRDAPVLRYQSKELHEQLPKRRDSKEKRVGDLTHPDGIMKSTWMYKMANLRPSAAAMFFDWDAADSKAKESDFAILVDNMRHAASIHCIVGLFPF